MNYNATCGFEPVPYTVKAALMGSNLLLAAASLFLLPAPRGDADEFDELPDAARQLQATFHLGHPPDRKDSCCSFGTRSDSSDSRVAPKLLLALKSAVLGPVALCFAITPIVKICWLATSIVKHVWGSDMSYLCGVAFVHDMDIVGCNLMIYGAVARPLASMARIAKERRSSNTGRWKLLLVFTGLFLAVSAAVYFLVAAVIYSAFAALTLFVYIWCWVAMCCPMCCFQSWVALKRTQRGSRVGPMATTDHDSPRGQRLGQYALPYLIFQSDARVFGATDKFKLLVHYALLQLNWLVPALLAGVGVQLFAGAGYMDAFTRDWEQRYVMPYIEGAIEGLKENVLGRAAMSTLSYFL